MKTPLSDHVLEAVNKIIIAAGIRTTFSMEQAVRCITEAARQIDALRASGGMEGQTP